MDEVKTYQWDSSEFLDTEENIAAYIDAVLEDGDPKLVIYALGEIARARGMTQIAKETGLARESLYHAILEEGNSEFSTVLKAIKSLGLKISASVAAKEPKTVAL